MYHPYESFEPVVKLVQMAAKDSDVVAIRMTLYRSGTNSPIVNALMLPPFYYKQVTEKGLEEYFDLVIDSVADERLRIYLYHFPKMSA